VPWDAAHRDRDRAASHRLANETEQALCRRMAVFDGGAALEILRAVRADPEWAETGLIERARHG
jgi:hypothetical protein